MVGVPNRQRGDIGDSSERMNTNSQHHIQALNVHTFVKDAHDVSTSQ